MPAIGEYSYSYSAQYSDYLSRFSTALLDPVKLDLREASTDFDEDIRDNIESCAEDLYNAGISISWFNPTGEGWKCDRQILRAVKWYCRSVYGLYNADMEKYDKAYRSLKATLTTQKKYTGEN